MSYLFAVPLFLTLANSDLTWDEFWDDYQHNAACTRPAPLLSGIDDTPERRLSIYAEFPALCFKQKWGTCADLFFSVCGDDPANEIAARPTRRSKKHRQPPPVVIPMWLVPFLPWIA